MKKIKIATATFLTAATLAVSASATLQQQAKAAGGTVFECAVYLNGKNKGVPVTVARAAGSSQGKAIINWKSEAFTDAGFDPLTRCQEVSARFQTYYNNGTLNYITTGKMNQQNVICVSGANGGKCTGLLFTLLPGANASQVIEELFAVRDGNSGPLNQTGERPYISFDQILNNAPAIQPGEIDMGEAGSSPATEPSSTPSSGSSW